MTIFNVPYYYLFDKKLFYEYNCHCTKKWVLKFAKYSHKNIPNYLSYVRESNRRRRHLRINTVFNGQVQFNNSHLLRDANIL